ncbi:HCLS1-associated protein X-1 [Onthophagus taurus]|uniref:HCLS1-associated protein X-1 n=1 Tax=Onthophagus taurus TaxID=166361 RepID=UPI0039BDA45E
MDLFGFFKGLFLPSQRESNHDYNSRSHYLRTDEDELDEYDPSDQNPRENEPFGFQIFSNPIEMQKYFEKQMEDMLKNFGFHHDDSFFGFSDRNSVGTQFGDFLEGSDEPPQGNSLRDQFLKPGYHVPNADVQKRSDDDVDGQIQPNDLDSMFKEKNSLTPYKPPNQSIFKSFGQSMSSKTIRNSDGSIETQRTVKDSQGNQENVVTKKWGDKEYTVITRTDKDGKQVVTENLVNMDENELAGFLKSSGNDRIEPKKPHNWFPFDKYFS